MSGWSRRARCAVFLVLLGANALTARAQVQARLDLVAPQPLTNPRPPAPTIEGGRSVEGWVTVRYSVLADGTTANIRVINHMPSSIDPAPTVTAVGRWTFEPGTREGAAIDWHNNESVVVFRLPVDAAEDTAFAAAYAAIATMLEAQPLGNSEALAASESLLDERATRLDGIGLALVQSALIHLGHENLHSSLERVRMATDPRVPILAGTELFPALQLRMQIEDQLGRTADAIATHARLLKGLGASNARPAFVQLGEQLKARVASEEFLESRGRIDGDGWRIDPTRRQFYIDSIAGAVHSIDAECDTRRVERPFDPEGNYVLPQSLGACSIFVRGEPGTTFSFVEVLSPEE